MPSPSLLVSDDKGNIFDLPDYNIALRSANRIYTFAREPFIPLPSGSQLFYLPGRRAYGYHKKTGRLTRLENFAVAAYLAPSYIQTAFPAYHTDAEAPRLPFFSYTAVGWMKGRYYVPAVVMDTDKKHVPVMFDDARVRRQVQQWMKRFPKNRLIAHHGLKCALEYGCPNARNLFLGRWEAPAAVSRLCNADCIGCISHQPSGSVPSPQCRLDFLPTVAEIVELAVYHLERAERAIVSFGQGCEGEPLLCADLIRDAIREIRRKTRRGVIHMNSNGSLPDKAEELFRAGLDSIRVSINSAVPEWYHRYFRPKQYTFDDLIETLKIGRAMNRFTSINYLIFPGITDTDMEFRALTSFIKKTAIHMIQWRNLNMDPDWYMHIMAIHSRKQPLGMHPFIRKIAAHFPDLLFGCSNKPESFIRRHATQTATFR